MAYNAQNYWNFVLCSSLGVLLVTEIELLFIRDSTV
jgi:hypothetical protein